VEQLFLLSRLDAGEGRTEWTRFDLAELARNTADQLSLLAEDKKISITCDASQVQLVEGDPVRLKQVIVNLLDNAIKYTPEQGAVRLRVLGRNAHVVLEVKDNGIGIPAEALPHIFERFYRVDKARSRDQGGTGLGLAIVKHIVQAHGGEVRCESELGHGATFYFTLPASETKGS
jgi:two-component system phosphate regulon sensor histidine kinase PhoR